MKRLPPFLHKSYPEFHYIFWPNLASAHYSNATVAWMDKNLNYVAKEINLPTVPQASPIKNFWDCLA